MQFLMDYASIRQRESKLIMSISKDDDPDADDDDDDDEDEEDDDDDIDDEYFSDCSL